MHTIPDEYGRRLVLAEAAITSAYKQKQGLLLALIVCTLLAVAALFLSMVKVLAALALVASVLVWLHQKVRRT